MNLSVHFFFDPLNLYTHLSHTHTHTSKMTGLRRNITIRLHIHILSISLTPSSNSTIPTNIYNYYSLSAVVIRNKTLRQLKKKEMYSNLNRFIYLYICMYIIYPHHYKN